MYLYNVEIADRCGMILSRTRANAGISRRAMSECINVSESTIKAWEAGQGSPTMSVILEWFAVVGENPFSYMLEFFWPETFSNLGAESTDTELRSCLSTYLEKVAGAREIRQLHYLVLENPGRNWSGVLDMFCAHAHTSLKNRYKIAEIIQTSYELSLANNNVRQTELFSINKMLIQEAITSARNATLQHKQGYTMYLKRDSYKSVSPIVMKAARADANVPLSYLAKAMGKTERTLRNWEQGTEATFLDMCAWFHILGKSMWDYMRREVITGEKVASPEKLESYRAELLDYFAGSDRSEIRKLCYLIFWRHGSNWHFLLELMTEHVSSPLYQRVISARSVLIGYEIDSHEALLYEPLGILPDLENLKICIEKGTLAAKNGEMSY